MSFQKNVSRTYINAIGIHTPTSYPQEEMLRRFDCENEPFVQQLNAGSAIDARCCNITPDVIRDMNQDERFEYAREQIPSMAYLALLRTGLNTKQLASLDGVICVTSTEMLFPGPAEVLGSKFGIGKPTCLRFNLVGHGCVGAIPGLQLAQSLVASGACTRVAVVGSEALIHQYNHIARERSHLITRLLFGEGSAAIIVSNQPAGEQHGPELLGYSSMLEMETLEHVSIGHIGGYPAPRVNHQVPSAGKILIGKVVARLVEDHGVSVGDVKHWAFHTGGRAVLDGCQLEMNLSDTQMAPSREILRCYGNMQSCSAMFSLHEVMKSTAPRPGELGALVAIGPGMLAGAYMLRW